MTQPIKLKSITNVRISLGNLQALRIGFMGKTGCFFCTFSNNKLLLTQNAQKLPRF